MAEWRLEVVCPESSVKPVIAALRSAHSYEEPAYDVYPLRPVPSSIGEGRIGRLPTTVLGDLAARVRSALQSGPVQVVGDVQRPVERLAIACGAAGEFLTDAVKAGADAFLIGEMRFHDYLAADALGVGLILPGHYATERFAVEELAALLSRRWPGIQVSPSRAETDPVSWV